MSRPAVAWTGSPLHVQERLKACPSLPSPPGVAMEILKLSQSDDIGTAQVAAVIRKDPALTAKLLKTANSAYFNTGAEATTVDRAVAVIGINLSLSLALSFSFVTNLRNCKSPGFNYQVYWRRSAITAVAARAIAGVAGRWPRPDELFVPGLLADIGMLGLSEAAPELYHPLVLEAEGDHDRLLQLERARLGMDHAEAGGWLLERWKIPRPLWLAVSMSHSGATWMEEDLEPFLSVVWMAGLVADIWCRKDTAGSAAAAQEAWATRLRLPVDSLTRVLDRVAAELSPVTSGMDIEIESQEEIARLFELAREALFSLNLSSQIEAEGLRQKASIDVLTGLSNRAFFDQDLQRRFERARDAGQPLSIIMLDIDHFKAINDTHGHLVGDVVLAWVAGKLRSSVRASDLVARYGGEEFTAVLDGTHESAARAMAERMRSAVEAEPCHVAGTGDVSVTISAGCTAMCFEHPSSSMLDLLQTADDCLYAAKRGGRNRVESRTLQRSDESLPTERSLP